MPTGGPVATAFSWGEIDAEWQSWSPGVYREILTTNYRTAAGYLGDLRGMEWADTCVLLLPCGRSAHIEAGYTKGRSSFAYDTRDQFAPDLMYLLADHIAIGAEDPHDVLLG